MDLRESTVVHGKLEDALARRLDAPIRVPERFLYRFEDATVTDALDIANGAPREDGSTEADVAIALSQPGDMMFGHWILDILPRLAATLPHLPDGDKIHLIVRDEPDVRDCYSIFHDIIAALIARPFEVAWLRPGDSVFCRELFAPAILRADDVFPTELGALFGQIKRAVKPLAVREAPSLVFASRAAWHIRERIMEDRGEIEELFRDRGFAIVHPEQYSMEELIGHYGNATLIAGERGSALHGAALAPNVSEFICFVGEHRSLQCMEFAQAALCAVLGLKSTYVTGPVRYDAGVEYFRIGADRARAVLDKVLAARVKTPSNLQLSL